MGIKRFGDYDKTQAYGDFGIGRTGSLYVSIIIM